MSIAHCAMAVATSTVIATGIAAPAFSAGSFPSWQETPHVTAIDPARFAALFGSGHESILRIALLGDSQETSPGGAGRTYLPNLNWRLFLEYGVVGETVLFTNTNTGGGAPPADWLARSGLASPTGPTSQVPFAARPPNLQLRRHFEKSAATQAYGLLAMLLHDGSLTADAQLPVEPYFDIESQVRAEVFAYTQPSSGEISWKAMPRATNVPSYFAAATGSGELDLDLSHPQLEVRSALTPVLDFAGKPFMQLEVWGTELETPTEILGLRFRDDAAHRGAVVQSLSKGGARARDFIEDHGECGPALAALGYHCAFLHFGANDAAGSIAPEQFQQDVSALVAWLREAMGDPEFPVVVLGDVHRKDFNPSQQAAFDGQPGAMAALAQQDPNLMAVNLRRITHEVLGWGPQDESFLVDVVHLTTNGQRLLAEVVVDTLLGVGTAVNADLDGDGVVDGADLGLLLSAWGGRGPADLDGSGTVDGGDLGILLANWS